MQARRPSSALLDTVKNVRKVFAGRTKSNHQLSKEQINEGMATSSSAFFQVRKMEIYAPKIVYCRSSYVHSCIQVETAI